MGENRKEERGFDKIVETIKIVEKGVVNGYKAVENATREQYKSIEETALRITKFAERNKKHD